MTSASPVASPARAVLGIRDFRLFLLARFLLTLALQMVSVAVGWQVYDMTHSPLLLGYVGLSQFLPAFLCSLPAGQVADRFDRRRVLVACMAVLCLAVTALLLVSSLPAPPVAAIFAIVAMVGATRAFLMPTTQSVLPLLVPTDLFSRAIAWSSGSMQAAVIAGPALGGALYIAGPRAVHALATLLLFVTALAVSRIRTPLRAHAVAGLGGVLDGIRYIRARKDILGAISLDLFAVLLGGATALLPVYARDILHIGPAGLGILRSAPAVGAASMALILAHRPLSRHTGPKLFAAVSLFGLATVAFGLSSHFALSLAALIVLGASDMVSVVIRQTLVQLRTPDSMRGRVSSVNFVFIGASNELGEFESGLTAAWFGTMPAVVVGGVGTLLVAALWAWRFPALRQADRLTLEESAPPPTKDLPSPPQIQ